MTSKDIDGTPILMLGLPDVKILLQMLDRPETFDQDKIVKTIVSFINAPDCLKWEEINDKSAR